jgi:hypothetical protein
MPSDGRPLGLRYSTDRSSFYYCSLQPKRDAKELRSFLSLDLAESQSLRSLGLKHQASCISKSTTWSSRPEMVLSPNCSALDSSHNNKPLRIRSSHESLRSIPSPKPVPSISLPKIPNPPVAAVVPASDLPPRLPPIPTTPPLRISTIAKLSTPSSSVRRRHPPPPPKIASTTTTPPIPVSRNDSTSTRTSSYRAASRSHALARLEGRSNSSRRRVQRNFMSMSDDEDDDEDLQQQQSSSDLDVDLASAMRLAAFLDEEDDLTYPYHIPPPLLSSSSSLSPDTPSTAVPQTAHETSLPTPKLSRSIKGKNNPPTESWFPMTSFLDAREEEWNWRSFIEFTSVS